MFGLPIYSLVNLHFFCQPECVLTLAWECVYRSSWINATSVTQFTRNPLLSFLCVESVKREITVLSLFCVETLNEKMATPYSYVFVCKVSDMSTVWSVHTLLISETSQTRIFPPNLAVFYNAVANYWNAPFFGNSNFVNDNRPLCTNAVNSLLCNSTLLIRLMLVAYTENKTKTHNNVHRIPRTLCAWQKRICRTPNCLCFTVHKSEI